MKTKDDTGGMLNISTVTRDMMRFNVVGTSPFVPHAMSAKSALDLLMGGQKKTAAEKAATLKHDPYEEFRSAAYVFRDQDETDTRLYIPGAMFHATMRAVAVDLAGAKKAQIGRLTSVPQMKIPLYGVPQIILMNVRQSGFPPTPDIRPLPILPRWACTVDVSFVASIIKPQSIANLLSNAGVITGVGDGRPEKGKLSMGCFRLCNDDDEEFLDIVAKSKRAEQDAALANPNPFDVESERLLYLYEVEKARRVASPIPSPRRKRTGSVTVNTNGGEEVRSDV